MGFLRASAMAAVIMALFASGAHAAPFPAWLPAWYASPEPVGGEGPVLQDTTLRQLVRGSTGGHQVRLRLSNAYGAEPLHLDDIPVARRDTGARIEATSDRPVTFGGRTGV